VLVSQAFELYCLHELKLRGGAAKTVRNYQSVLNVFIRICGDIPVSLVTRDHVIRWRLCLEAEGIQLSTMSSYLSKLRQVLKYLKTQGYNVLDYQQVALPTVVITERDFVTSDEAKRMVEAAERLRDKALIATLWSSGSRIAEILNLNRDSIQNGRAYVIGKNSKQVVVRIDSTAQKHIRAYLDSRSDRLPALFISAQMRRLNVQRAEQIVNQIAGELGLSRPDGTEKRVTPHTFRHGHATDLLTNGADLATVQQLLGHSNISTTRIYAHVSQQREDEMYSRFHSS